MWVGVTVIFQVCQEIYLDKMAINDKLKQQKVSFSSDTNNGFNDEILCFYLIVSCHEF